MTRAASTIIQRTFAMVVGVLRDEALEGLRGHQSRCMRCMSKEDRTNSMDVQLSRCVHIRLSTNVAADSVPLPCSSAAAPASSVVARAPPPSNRTYLRRHNPSQGARLTPHLRGFA